MPLPQLPAVPRRIVRSRTKAVALLGVVALLLSAAALRAEPGAVLTKDNRDYFGDVTANPNDGPVTIVVKMGPGAPQPIQIKRGNVERVTIFKSPRDEFDYRTARAGKVAARHVETARWAMAQNEPEWAQQSLASARALQPNDPNVQKLEKDLATARPKAPADPATQPARPATMPAAPAAKRSRPAIRTLTPDEINVLRQMEWKGEEQVTVKIDPDLRKRYMDLTGITNAQARQMSPQQMALDILRNGTPDMKQDLKLVNDPLTLRDWRQNINNKIIGTNTGCAAAACHHPQSKAGDFVLFHGNDDAAGLTNFVIVNQYSREVVRPKERPQQYLMIDRTQPQQSLLLQYALPVNMAQMPHPKVEGYNGVIRNRTDRNFSTLSGWLTDSLTALPPPYAEPEKGEMFDLTTEPKEKPARPADKAVDKKEPAAQADSPARLPRNDGGPGPNGLPGRQARPPQ